MSQWDGPAASDASAAAENSQGLFGTEIFRQTIGQIPEGEAVSADVWFCVDPWRLDFLMTRAEGRTEESFSETFAVRHGFSVIKGMGGCVSVGSAQYDSSYRLRVWQEGEKEKGMLLLNWQNLTGYQPNDWVPLDHVSSYATIAWDLPPILHNVAPLADELVADTTGRNTQPVAQFLETIRAEDGLDLDLEEELLAFIGPRIEYINLVAEEVSKSAEQSVVAIEVSDERQVAELLELLLIDDSCVEIPLRPLPYSLWKLGTGARAGDQQISFSTPGFMVANQRLFFASNYAAIEQLIRPAKRPRQLKDDPLVRRMSEDLSKRAGTQPALRILAFPNLDFRTSYELLRTGQSESAESIYTMLLAPLLAQVEDPSVFKRLPRFVEFAATMGPACIQLNLVDEGWEIVGFNYNAEFVAAPELVRE